MNTEADTSEPVFPVLGLFTQHFLQRLLKKVFVVPNGRGKLWNPFISFQFFLVGSSFRFLHFLLLLRNPLLELIQKIFLSNHCDESSIHTKNILQTLWSPILLVCSFVSDVGLWAKCGPVCWQKSFPAFIVWRNFILCLSWCGYHLLWIVI